MVGSCGGGGGGGGDGGGRAVVAHLHPTNGALTDEREGRGEGGIRPSLLSIAPSDRHTT